MILCNKEMERGALAPFFVPRPQGLFPIYFNTLPNRIPGTAVEYHKNPYRDKLNFPKREKLKGKKQIEALFAQGKHLGAPPLKLIYHKTDFGDGVPFKVAVVAPKKRFRDAVDRNRIKRLLREAYRLNKPHLFNNIEGSYAFLFLYLGPKPPTFAQVDLAVKELIAAFLKKESHEKNP